LDKGTNAASFIDGLKRLFDKDMLPAVTDFDKEMADIMASYQGIVAIMGISMLVITVLLIFLIMYFMINNEVIRKKTELGIQKALGFTTFQLMNQFALCFIFPIIFGTVIGSILGGFYSNTMTSVFMKSMGVVKTMFIVDYNWIAVFTVAVIVFSYILSLLILVRIRKISAYKLITE
jgi:putative ABC transport system permease protein